MACRARARARLQAPEIVEGKGHGLTVDWWSVGVLVYEMLCGMPPFRAKSRQALQQQILTGKIKWPSEWRTRTRTRRCTAC